MSHLRLACVLALFGALALVSTASASAATLKLSATSGTPGTSVNLTGSGFAPNETLQLQFDATNAGTAVANASGKFAKLPLGIPSSATPRAHVISAVGPSGQPSAQTTFKVTTPWTQGGFDVRRLGDNPFENYLDSGTVASLDRRWTGALTALSSAAPAVAQGLAITGDQSGHVAAFKTGCGVAGAACSPTWTATLGGGVRATPAIAGGVVYVGAGDGDVYAFSLTCKTGGAKCAPKWTGTTGGAINGAVAVSGSSVYVPSTDGSLYVFPTACSATCAPRWQADLGSSVTGVAVSGGNVFARTSTGIDALPAAGCGAATCSPAWSASAAMQTGSAVPLVSNGVVYVGTSDSGVVRVLGFPVTCASGGATCSPRQTISTPLENLSGLAIAGGRLYVTDEASDVIAYTATCASSCAALWHGAVPGQNGSLGGPTVAADVLYVPTLGGIGAFPAACRTDGGTCTPLWTSPVSDEIFSGVSVSDGMLYAPVYDGNGGSLLVAWTPNGQAIPAP